MNRNNRRLWADIMKTKKEETCPKCHLYKDYKHERDSTYQCFCPEEEDDETTVPKVRNDEVPD